MGKLKKNKNKDFFLDKIFEGRSTKEVIMIFLSVIVLIAFLVFHFLFPKVHNIYQKEKKVYSKNKQELNKLKVKENVLKVQTITYQTLIKENEKKHKLLKRRDDFYNDLISVFDFIDLKFNQNKWVNYTKNMVINAEGRGLKVLMLRNIFFEDTTKYGRKMKKIFIIGGNIDKNKKKTKKKFSIIPKKGKYLAEKMNILLKIKGNLLDLIKYIYYYENRKDLIRLEEFNISDNNIYNLRFGVYAMNDKKKETKIDKDKNGTKDTNSTKDIKKEKNKKKKK